MKILIVNNTVIPALKYGGTERVIWYLGKELVKMGHQVDYLVKKGSSSSFATKVMAIEESKPIEDQIPEGYDVVHFNFNVDAEKVEATHIVTIHGNTNEFLPYNKNAVFVSKNHAERHQSQSFVYNGLDFSDYGKVDFSKDRKWFHFLGNVVWKEKNAKGAIDIAKRAKQKIVMLGGERFSTKMGIKFFPQLNARFAGQVDESGKNKYINQSKGLIFPVKWNEPFGLSMIESLYYGSPVFGTKHGSLPEIITPEVGFLSNDSQELVDAIKNNTYNPKVCHHYAVDNFNSKLMAERYVEKYKLVLSGEDLNADFPVLKEKQESRFLEYN
ncbi:MAG: glycosyltransferase [Flavobacteriales bacterium]